MITSVRIVQTGYPLVEPEMRVQITLCMVSQSFVETDSQGGTAVGSRQSRPDTISREPSLPARTCDAIPEAAGGRRHLSDGETTFIIAPLPRDGYRFDFSP